MTIYKNARIYWQMYGGVVADGLEQRVRRLHLDMDVGGWAAADKAWFQLSIYGRATIDGPNLVTIHRQTITRPAGANPWKGIVINEDVTHADVRCVVVKLELIYDNYEAPDASAQTFTYDDQYSTADPPPWGIRLHHFRIYGSSLVDNVYPDQALRDILETAAPAFTFSGPTVMWEADQLTFTEVPKDRWEAIDEINGLLGWNYACWNGTLVTFSTPKSGTAWQVAADDPRTTWNVSESLDETYNAVRVKWTSKRGVPRETIVHVTSPVLTTTRADCIDAPDSVRSKAAAERFGTRYLNSHKDRQVEGTLYIAGDDGVLDALLIRPGDTITMSGPARFLTGTHEVTSVTLHPLDWSADIQFGSNSKRFDTWLARLAVGAKRIKRR